MNAPLGFHLDASACIGCRTCVIACKSKNQLPVGRHYRRVVEYGGGSWIPDPDDPSLLAPSGIFAYCLSIACMHCQDPACASACIVGALSKNANGSVSYDVSKCIGCRYCMVACPFRMTRYEWESVTPRVRKCQFCPERVSEGKPTACAEACPMEALTLGYRDELLRVARKRIREVPGRYHKEIYGEFEAGGTSWLYLSPVPFEQAGFDTRVPRQPILHYVKDFLAVVPMVLTIWPGLFAGIYLLAKSKNVSERTHSQEDKRNETIEQ